MNYLNTPKFSRLRTFTNRISEYVSVKSCLLLPIIIIRVEIIGDEEGVLPRNSYVNCYFLSLLCVWKTRGLKIFVSLVISHYLYR